MGSATWTALKSFRRNPAAPGSGALRTDYGSLAGHRGCGAHDAVVVDQQDLDGSGRGSFKGHFEVTVPRSTPARRTDTVTVVPSPGELLTVNSAPIVSARSVIVDRPM